MGSLKILVLIYIKSMHVSDILKSKTGYVASSVCPVECLHETPVGTLPDFCEPYGDHKFQGDLGRKYYTAWEWFYFTSKGVTWAGISQSVHRFATGWTVRGSNPIGGEFFRTRPDRPWGPLSLLYIGYLVFPGGEAAGAWRWPPAPI